MNISGEGDSSSAVFPKDDLAGKSASRAQVKDGPYFKEPGFLRMKKVIKIMSYTSIAVSIHALINNSISIDA
jgi:hypothetical protein